MMKKVRIILVIIFAVAAVGLWGAALMIQNDAKTVSYGEVTVVETADRTESMVPAFLVKEEYVPIVPDGVNITSVATIEVNNFNEGFPPAMVKDGKTADASYWEGAPNEYPNIISAEFEQSFNIHAIKLCLCPLSIWGPRIQTFSVEISTDGENFTEFIPSTDYQFDPDTGNEVILEFDTTQVKAVQLTFTANTGAVGAQIAELEIYTEDINDISELEAE
uniref:discoidin domain-containing protein n=1 Tax=Acetatifactor sp. TaxID=1872090 RepID=UPI004057287C